MVEDAAAVTYFSSVTVADDESVLEATPALDSGATVQSCTSQEATAWRTHQILQY